MNVTLHHYIRYMYWCFVSFRHSSDVIMGAIASQITGLTIVYSTVYSDADQRKHQSSASPVFVRGIHRGPVNPTHKWPVTRKKCFDLMTSSYIKVASLSGVPDYFGRNKILSGYDLSHYQVPHCFKSFLLFCLICVYSSQFSILFWIMYLL